MSFQLVLREGILGGFAGPTIKKFVEIRGDDSSASIIQGSLKPNSKADYNTFAGEASGGDLADFLGRLQAELQELPTEEPVGSEDIYGQDISLTFLTEDFQWSNGGPEGCNQGESEVKASPEQIEKFKQIIDVVKGLGEQYAITAQ